MAPIAPLIEDWRHLYKAAVEFKELGPWQWMDDTDSWSSREISGPAGEYNLYTRLSIL